MFGSIGGPELLVIFLVALLIFGPRKLPELGKMLGKGLGEFRRAANDLRVSLETEVAREAAVKSLPPSAPTGPAATEVAETSGLETSDGAVVPEAPGMPSPAPGAVARTRPAPGSPAEAEAAADSSAAPVPPTQPATGPDGREEPL